MHVNNWVISLCRHAIELVCTKTIISCDVVVDKYKNGQPDYFPEQLVDNWSSFSRRGFYYCYMVSLEGCSKTTPAEIVLAVKCNMGSDFISNSFKLWGVQDYLSFTMRYVGIIHLNQEQVGFDSV
jgi:endoribonuclease Dicer